MCTHIPAHKAHTHTPPHVHKHPCTQSSAWCPCCYQVLNRELQGRPNAFRTLSNAIRRGLRDRVANVFLSALSLYQTVVDGFASSTGAKDIQVRSHRQPGSVCGYVAIVGLPGSDYV